MKNVVLDLCGGTGAWSKPYRDAGYDVRVITLPEHDVGDVRFHLPGDRIGIYSQTDPRNDIIVSYGDIYGILAAPPCTEFSLAKGSRPRDFQAGLKTVNDCLNIIQECRTRTRLAFWALENPVGFLRQFLGRPHYTFEHWQFWGMGIKPTDVWGWFREPAATVKEKPAGLTKRYGNGKTNAKGWCNAACPDAYKGLGLGRAAIRAITPAGFAQAFFRANSKEV